MSRVVKLRTKLEQKRAEDDHRRLKAFERDWLEEQHKYARRAKIVDGFLLVFCICLMVAALGIVAGWW